MKKLVMILSATLLLSACSTSTSPVTGIPAVISESSAAAPATDFALETGPEPVAEPNRQVQGDVQIGTSIEGLSLQEIADLRYMREEEKLARDVYLKLSDLWGMDIFQNIAQSEETHMAAVLNLLEGYGLEDPAYGLSAGEFSDQALQDLYSELVAQGSLSLADALKGGALIEEIDIRDLEDAIGQAEQADIIRLYESLLRGSSNHLKAFTILLVSQTGEAYVPQYLDLESYQAIMEAAGGGSGPGGWGGMTGSGGVGGQRRGGGRNSP